MMIDMLVTVFGATGKIGSLVLDDLLTGRHEVIAFVRNPAKVLNPDPRLRIVTGELSDRPRVHDAVRGADAVISALGPSLKRSAKGTPVTDGTRNIVSAMETANVSRYLGLATPSVPDVRDQPTLKAKILPVMAGLLFPNALREIVGMTAAVTESELDWTIARITSPNDGKLKGTVRAGFLGRDKVGWAMTRADIARFLVDQLTDSTYVRAAPVISN